MKTTVVIVALLAATAGANAQARNPNNGTLVTTIGTALLSIPYHAPHSSGGIARVEAQESRERDARIAKWENYCDPVLSAPNANGVRRYLYAKPGCEFGKSED